jgi:peptide/nickel transport system substrate-binding protein
VLVIFLANTCQIYYQTGGVNMKEIKMFKQMYRDGRMSRREFLAAMSALGLVAAAPGFLKSANAMSPTPRKGGTLRMASFMHGPDDQMDPSLFTSTIDYTRGRATYNSLTQLGDDLAPKPELAEEWTSNSNATEFTFKIRKGVQFHDGSPLTADDVVWSMNRHMGENSTSVVKPVMASVSEWKKIDSHTVKAVLNTPNADLPILLGIFHTKIVKKDTTDFNKGNGTGPFVLESFEPGVKSVHIRNQDYWREGPYLDRVEITAITDPSPVPMLSLRAICISSTWWMPRAFA